MLRLHPGPSRRLSGKPLLIAALSLGLGMSLPWQAAVAADKPDPKTGTRYKADKDMARVLDALAAAKPRPIETLTVEEARKQPSIADAYVAVLKAQDKSTDPAKRIENVSVSDRSIPGAAGALPARVYTPNEGGGPFPVIVYFHGGGWVLGSKEAYDAGARGLAGKVKAVVLSVDYRLAPEHKFPAQHDDALATYRWVAQNAAEIRGDPKRLALVGESAGGNLALSTAVAVRSAGMTPPQAVVAVYPVVQLSNMDTPSYRDSAQARPLNKAMMGWFADQVFTSPGQRDDPRVNLLRADLSGLPPTTVINAEIDPLRSDGDMLVEALRKANVSTVHRVYDGVTHEFFGMEHVLNDARDAQRLAAKELRQGFERSMRVSDVNADNQKVNEDKKTR